MKITYKMVKPMNVRSRLFSYNKKKQITNINVTTLKLLIKTSFFNKSMILCASILSNKSLMKEATKCLFRGQRPDWLLCATVHVAGFL